MTGVHTIIISVLAIPVKNVYTNSEAYIYPLVSRHTIHYKVLIK